MTATVGLSTTALSTTGPAIAATSADVPRTSAGTATLPPGPASAALAELPVKGRAPLTGYDRAQYGQAWSDDVDVVGGHNGCDTRNDVLRRDLRAVVIKPDTHGCVAAAGTLTDPYSGRMVDFVRGPGTSTVVQIDHVVALADSWQTGAAQLTAQQRQDLANDPLELLAVDGRVNEAKGGSNAASWLPPAKTFRCRYVARQIAVKTRYRLWVIPAERDAMARVLAGCPGQPLPTTVEVDIARPVG